jgi:hypothetical protein
MQNNVTLLPGISHQIRQAFPGFQILRSGDTALRFRRL